MSITVFLVDDYAMIRDGLRLLLETRQNIKVIGDAANGRDAVYRVAQLRPDVVIMDISMPELDGIEATRQIRELCPSTQVIIFSIHSTAEHIFRALQAGARGYLLKEAAGVEVVDAVLTVHAGHRYLSPKVSDWMIDDYVRQRGAVEAERPLVCLSTRKREAVQCVVEDKSRAESPMPMSSLPALS